MSQHHQSATAVVDDVEIVLDDGSWPEVSWDRPALIDEADRWPASRWWWLVPLAALTLIIPAFFITYRHVEDDIEKAAPEILREQGIDPSGLTFDATFRDVEVGGTLPPGVTAAEVERALETNNYEGGESEDIRDATVAAVPAAAPVLGPIDVALVSEDGQTVTLRGIVPSGDHRDALVAAAGAAGLTVVDELTVSGLEPSSADADIQVGRLGQVLAGLTPGSFLAADLVIGDDGPVIGSIDSATAQAASSLQALAGEAVEVTGPPPLGQHDVSVSYERDGRIRLTGTVLDESERLTLVDAAGAVVTPANVIDELEVSSFAAAVDDSAARVGALASAMATFPGLRSAEATLSDTELRVSAVADDAAAAAATEAAVAATGTGSFAGQSDIVIAEPEDPAEPEPTIAEETSALQEALVVLHAEIGDNVRFETGSAQLVPEARATLDKVAVAMARYQRPVLEVGGHTDNRGADTLNLELSQARAASVVAYLVSVGVEPSRLVGVGFGEIRPVADNDTPEGRELNRRVEFVAKEAFDA